MQNLQKLLIFIQQFSVFSKNGLCFLKLRKRAEFSKILMQNFYILMYCQHARACLCVYVFGCMCAWACVCLGVCACVSACECVCSCVCVYVCLCVFVSMHVIVSFGECVWANLSNNFQCFLKMVCVF